MKTNTNKNQNLMCLTNQITKHTSGKLLFTFVIMFRLLYCKYLYILGLFIAPYHIPY